jgi:hypothetical protein
MVASFVLFALTGRLFNTFFLIVILHIVIGLWFGCPLTKSSSLYFSYVWELGSWGSLGHTAHILLLVLVPFVGPFLMTDFLMCWCLLTFTFLALF